MEYAHSINAWCNWSSRSLQVNQTIDLFYSINTHQLPSHFRDPRTRRLAEQQKNLQKNTEAVPEKLSFKEKMKMFALETGEAQTPKDKLKISRAQRDIDAVH